MSRRRTARDCQARSLLSSQAFMRMKSGRTFAAASDKPNMFFRSPSSGEGRGAGALQALELEGFAHPQLAAGEGDGIRTHQADVPHGGLAIEAYLALPVIGSVLLGAINDVGMEEL